MVPLPPLDSPKTLLRAATPFGCAAKRGLRGLDSGRRAAFETLYCPEFTLCYPPRITVRGQTVQSVRLVLRKALLRSMVCSWSTRRPCGPLAFRRATEGSRVQRKGWGVKRGRETLVSLPLLPPPPGGGNAHAMSWQTSPSREGLPRLQRRAAVSTEGIPSADGKIFQRMPHSCEYHCAASGTATPPRRYSAASAHFARYDRASSNQTSCSVPPRQKL